MDLGFKIVKSASFRAGFGVHHKRSLVQNKIIERVVYSNTLSINWFSYCSKRNNNSYLVSSVYKFPRSKNTYSGIDQSVDTLGVVPYSLRLMFLIGKFSSCLLRALLCTAGDEKFPRCKIFIGWLLYCACS